MSGRTPNPKVGDRVAVERDETAHPPRGTWRWYHGKTGTVTEVNRAGRGATEYGVSFTKSRGTDAWFKNYELTVK